MDTQRDRGRAREKEGEAEEGVEEYGEMEGRRCSDLHIGILTELDAGKYGRATQL